MQVVRPARSPPLRGSNRVGPTKLALGLRAKPKAAATQLPSAESSVDIDQLTGHVTGLSGT